MSVCLYFNFPSQVLLIPQSPAIRGQEALARVCFALEQILRQMNIGATIISDYKFKESYMRHAPQEVLKVLTCPEEEGSHDILMVGPDIGIICVQVCMKFWESSQYLRFTRFR